MADALSIERQIEELLAAGWVRYRDRQTMWVDPKGDLWRGPHGAWKAMRALADAESCSRGLLGLLNALDEAFCDGMQLVNAWKMDTPSEQWSEWDEQTRLKMMAVHRRVLKAISALKESGSE